MCQFAIRLAPFASDAIITSKKQKNVPNTSRTYVLGTLHENMMVNGPYS